MNVQPKIAVDQKRKWNLMEDKITTIVEEMEDRQHVLFGGLNSGLSNKAKHAAKECVANCITLTSSLTSSLNFAQR